jgi:hypothetical protein
MCSKDSTKVSPNLFTLLQGPDSTTNALPANGNFLNFRILVQRKHVGSVHPNLNNTQQNEDALESEGILKTHVHYPY